MKIADREQLVAELVKSALERGHVEQAKFLDEACGQDADLRVEVEALLKFEEPARDFIESPAYEKIAGIMAEKSGELEAGEVLGDCKILSLLGEGGMGEVYLAEDTKLKRKVAIKLLKLGLGTANIIRHFHEEERILAGLTHPNIAQLHSGGLTPNGLPYFVMEYVDGLRLDDYCREKYRLSGSGLSIQERLELFRKICAAVSYAHQHLVIHRDIKPANIRVTASGEPKLLDFGVAKLVDPVTSGTAEATMTFAAVMTPEYASPEQVRGQTMTTVSDVYSLGVVLYELLTGQKPYKIDNRTPAAVARAITEQEPLRPSTAIVRGQRSEVRSRKLLRGDLDNIVLKALRKEPERRYASVGQFSEDIRRHLEGRPVLAHKGTVRYRASKFIARYKAGVAAVALVVLALVAGIITTAWQARIATIERARAERRFSDVRHLAESFMFEIHDSIQNLAGSTPARRLLVSRALQYLDSLAGEMHNDQTLQRELATAYQKLGDIQGNPYVPNLGDTEGAFRSYKKALAIRQSLALAFASDEAQEELAKSYRAMGDILEQKGNIANSVESFRKSLALFETLFNAHSTDRRLADELARAYDALGDGLRRTDRASEKMEPFRKAVAIWQRLLAHDPNNRRLQRSLAVGLMKLGDGWEQNKTEAIESLRKSLAIVESLAASDPANARAQRDFGLIAYRFGEVLNMTGDYSAALEEFQKSLPVYERLAAADPKDIQARFDTASVRADMAEAFLNGGDVTHALDHATKSLLMFRELVAADPANMVYRRSLGLCYEMLGKAHALTGARPNLAAPDRIKEWIEGRESYQKAADVVADLVKRGALRPSEKNKPEELAAQLVDCDNNIEHLRHGPRPTK
jgi:tetratricopeptide (TPR) repeat protein/tRNA A-37 threonylcarbamoyl transferase component Bud32